MLIFSVTHPHKNHTVWCKVGGTNKINKCFCRKNRTKLFLLNLASWTRSRRRHNLDAKTICSISNVVSPSFECRIRSIQIENLIEILRLGMDVCGFILGQDSIDSTCWHYSALRKILVRWKMSRSAFKFVHENRSALLNFVIKNDLKLLKRFTALWLGLLI